MDIFKDILASKRDGYNLSHFINVPRPEKFHFKKDVFDQQLVRQYAMEAIANKGIVKRLSDELNLPEADLMEKIENLYREIERGRNSLSSVCFAFGVLKIMKNTIKHFFVSQQNFLKMPASIGNKPVILLPTHRSYADFIVLSFILYDANIECPSIISGIDLSKMLFMSRLLRDGGALFMRRSFRNDKVYSAAFKTYLQTLLTKADAPLEVFIEGTRSRSGKSLMPKFGCLKIITDLFTSGQESDIVLVPISMHYDKVPEDELYAYEQLGQSKPKESTMKLLRGLYTMMTKNHGNIYVNFNEPILLSEYADKHEQTDLDVLAHTIISSQNKNTVFTSTDLLCTVLVSSLYSSVGCFQFSTSHVIARIRQLKRLLTSFGIMVNFEDEEDSVALKEIERTAKIHDNLVTLNDKQDVISVNVTSQNRSTSPDYHQSDRLLLITLQFYANSCVQLIINAATIVCLLSSSKPVNKDALFKSYSFFRDIFKHEFVFHRHFETEEFQKAFQVLNSLDMIRDDDSSVGVYLVNDDNLVGRSLLKPFVEGFYLICEFFLQNSDKTFDRKTAMVEIRKYASCKFQQSGYEFWQAYGLSTDFISNSLASLSDMNAVDFNKLDQGGLYELKNSVQLAEIMKFLRTIKLGS